jgi:hypothetical protein
MRNIAIPGYVILLQWCDRGKRVFVGSDREPRWWYFISAKLIEPDDLIILPLGATWLLINRPTKA